MSHDDVARNARTHERTRMEEIFSQRINSIFFNYHHPPHLTHLLLCSRETTKRPMLFTVPSARIKSPIPVMQRSIKKKRKKKAAAETTAADNSTSTSTSTSRLEQLRDGGGGSSSQLMSWPSPSAQTPSFHNTSSASAELSGHGSAGRWKGKGKGKGTAKSASADGKSSAAKDSGGRREKSRLLSGTAKPKSSSKGSVRQHSFSSAKKQAQSSTRGAGAGAGALAVGGRGRKKRSSPATAASAAKPRAKPRAAAATSTSKRSKKRTPSAPATATATAKGKREKQKAKAKPAAKKRKRASADNEDDDGSDASFGEMVVKVRPVGTATRRATSIYDLDVAVDVVERTAREYALGVDSRTARRALTDFVKEVESIVMDSVEMLDESRVLIKALRSAEAKKRRLRKELLEVQQQRLEVTTRLKEAESEFGNAEANRKDAEEAHTLLCDIDTCNAAAGGVAGKKKAAKLSVAARARAELPGLWATIEACLCAGPHLKRANDLLEAYVEKFKAGAN